MRIGLVQARFPESLESGIKQVVAYLEQAHRSGCEIVCFPEAYLPGMRAVGFDVPPYDHAQQQCALEAVQRAAREHGVAVVLPMEWQTEKGLHNAAFVIDEAGSVLGYQTKNQIAPEEEPFFVRGAGRKLFTVKGVPFGIAICHEGWRYPETVRWAATRGAKIVFHPQITGGVTGERRLTRWGDVDNPWYEKAMVCRAQENSIYFASVNYAMACQESATSLISPAGKCLAYVPYSEEGLLVADLDLNAATGLLASRYNPALYGEL